MPKELAHFKNFAKLRDTSVAFNDITVIAGKPGTGKSYVMKFMYAWHETLAQVANKTYLIHYALMDPKKDPLSNIILLRTLANSVYKNDKDIENIFYLMEQGNFIEAKRIFDEKNRNLDESKKIAFDLIEKSLLSLSMKQQEGLALSSEDAFKFLFRNILQSIFGDIEQISSSIDIVFEKLSFSYSGGEFNFKNIDLNKQALNAIFVETPLILEFEKFLPHERFGTPYHIDSLINYLNTRDYAFTSDEEDKFVKAFKKSVKSIIKGSISRQSSGFEFVAEDGTTYSAVNTSSGTKSIGLLQYLVTNKALKKGSVLYWEEPEVHLHPEWQLRMIELFVELMQAGVKIVFSTHSPYMCDYLNAVSKKQKFSDRVSFNLFEEREGVVENHILENQKDWNKIQSELLDPLEEIMWEYV